MSSIKDNEWATAMLSLTPLPQDNERFDDAYTNGFSKVGGMGTTYKAAVSHFDSSVKKQLADTFSSTRCIKVLGVGVGEGRHELHFLKSLSSHFKSIRLVAVDPNHVLLDTFKRKVENVDTSASITCDMFPCGFRDFTKSSTFDLKYDLISAVHSLYYSGDLTVTVEQMLSMLSEIGILLVVIGSEDCVHGQAFIKKPWLTERCGYRMKTSSDVRAIAERNGYDVTVITLPTRCDFTDILNAESEYGNKILDFLTMTSHFRQTAPSAILEDVLSFWRSRLVRGGDGRLTACGDAHIILISKPAPEKATGNATVLMKH